MRLIHNGSGKFRPWRQSLSVRPSKNCPPLHKFLANHPQLWNWFYYFCLNIMEKKPLHKCIVLEFSVSWRSDINKQYHLNKKEFKIIWNSKNKKGQLIRVVLTWNLLLNATCQGQHICQRPRVMHQRATLWSCKKTWNTWPNQKCA